MALIMNAGGRELLFRFTVRAWVEIEEKLGSLNRLLERIDSDDAPVTAMIGIAEIVTEDDLINSLSPKQIKMANRLAKTALTIGMRREEAEQDDDEVIDVVLEELRQEELKKKEEAPSASAADSASATD